MHNLTTYWFIRMRQSKSSVTVAKFDRLVKVVFDNLTKNVYSLITYTEAKQREQETQAAAARAAKNKGVDPAVAKARVLRETKHIPNLILKVETVENDLMKLGKRMGQDLCEVWLVRTDTIKGRMQWLNRIIIFLAGPRPAVNVTESPLCRIVCVLFKSHINFSCKKYRTCTEPAQKAYFLWCTWQKNL